MLQLGILGYPLSHSRSPQIQTAGGEYLGLKIKYGKFEIPTENFTSTVPELLQSVNGLNVTIPYKENVLKYLNKADDLVKRIGACNTLVIKNGYIHGFNTDYYGFKESLAGHDLAEKKASIIGAGGASKAVIIALEDMGVKDIEILARNPDKVKDKLPKTHKSKITLTLLDDELSFEDTAILINSTPVGQGRLSNSMPVSDLQIDTLPKDAIVYDLIYSETLFLKTAHEKGLTTIDGSQMLILQGVKSLSLWTEQNITPELIKKMTEAFNTKIKA